MAPSCRASDSPIATACLRPVTLARRAEKVREILKNAEASP